MALTMRRQDRGDSEERRYVLKLRIGDIEFSREFRSWEELAKYKDIVKQYGYWDSAKRMWYIDYFIFNVDGLTEKLAPIFDVEKERLVEAIRRLNEQILRELRERVRGTHEILAYGLLSDEEFRKVKAYATYIGKVSGKPAFRFEPALVVDDLALSAKSVEDVSQALDSWIVELKKLPLIFDEDAIRAEISRIWSDILERRRVRAEYVVERDEDGERERGWVKLSFSEALGKRIWGIKEELMKIREIPYNIEVFEEGERRLKTVIIYGVKFKKEEPNSIYVAPFMYREVKEMVEKMGFKIEDSGIQQPSLSPILIEDIEHRLRPYQRESFRKWLENGCRGSIAIPTGGGKTWVGLATIARLRVPAVIFVPTIDLAVQWREKFLKPVLGLREEDIGILGGGYHEIGKPILVSTYDSGVRFARELAKTYSLYIFDEGHHVAAESFKEIAWHMLAPYRMVLSATIERDDQNEGLIYRMCGSKVYEIPFFELVRQGYLSPVKVEFIEVPFPPDEEKMYSLLDRELEEVKAKFRELYKKYESAALAEGYTDVGEYLRKTKNPEYLELNSKALSLRQRMRLLEQKNSNKVVKAIEIAKKHLAEGSKIFVFTNLIEQAERIYFEIAKIYPDAKLITSKTSQEEREMLFKLFAEGKLRCIVTTTVLDEGIDAPDADVAIVVSSRAIRHPRQFVQRIGRIVRPKPNKISYVYILRTRGGVEEATLVELMAELDKVYQFSRMEELIRAREKVGGLIVFEARASLEKSKRAGGHKARIIIYSSALKELIGRRAHVKVYDPEGKLVKECDLIISRKVYKGYDYGKLSISLPIEYGGKKMRVEVYPY